jgi:serine O-acetyltransferase
VFGYGLVIPHYGTIVVGETNRCGNYCVLHTSTCISGNGKVIGDALYLATGVKMTTNLSLGNNVMIGANSLVNKSFPGGGIMIAGTPAREIKKRNAWYIEENSVHKIRVASIEELKLKMKI